jgi:hypothetical protein
VKNAIPTNLSQKPTANLMLTSNMKLKLTKKPKCDVSTKNIMKSKLWDEQKKKADTQI